MTLPGYDRIPELLAEGRELLGRSRFPEASDVFGRILLLDPGNAGARTGFESARRAAAEAQRRLDASLDEARLAMDAGETARARQLLEDVVEKGGNRDTARSLLDRLDRREGRLFEGPAVSPAAEPAEPAPPRSGALWSRRVLVGAWVAAFALLAAGVASSWERLVLGLVEPPTPAPVAGPPATEAPASAGEKAIVEARRLADNGDAAGALAILDRIPPDEPAYPFARQFRAQVEAAVRRGAWPR